MTRYFSLFILWMGVTSFTLASAFVGLGYIGLAHLEETDPSSLDKLGGISLWYFLGLVLIIMLASITILSTIHFASGPSKTKKEAKV